MSIFAQIALKNQLSNTDSEGTTYTTADVYIVLTDENGNAVNGNDLLVTVAYNNNGYITNTAYTVPGQSLAIYTGVITRSIAGAAPFDVRSFAVVNTTLQSIAPASPAFCDLAITSITVDKPESAPGAFDAQMTIHASSSYGPILYSNDLGVTYQSSPTFTGLGDGLQQPLVKDANNCSAQGFVNIPVLANLLVSDPSVTLAGGYISRFNAAFNPVIFTYQRKDFEVTGITRDENTGNASLMVNASLTSLTTNYNVVPNDKVYLNAPPYQGVYSTEAVSGTGILRLATPYIGNATGFININRLRAYYKILTRITYSDAVSRQQQTIVSVNRPNSTGLVKADIANFLQSTLQAADVSDYTQTNFTDHNLSAGYQVAYAQSWDDGTPAGYTAGFISITDPYYVLYAAKQLGDRFGGNLAAYVPFPMLNNQQIPARWITDFAEPAFSRGYPFDIGYLYTSALDGLQLYCRLTLLDINRDGLPGGLTGSSILNEDDSYLLNQDGSKFNIISPSQVDLLLAPQYGLNRLLINYNFPDDVYYFTVAIYYQDKENVQTVTQTQTIRIDDAVDEQSVYLRWIGLSGSWNYYRFVYNQEISLDVQNAVIVKKFVSDWENQDSIEEVISKSAGQKMKLMAEDLSINDIRGLQSVKYSPKVQLLINSNPVKWQTIVINTATYTEYETFNGQAAFSITFNMPSINIQSQ